MRRQTSPVRADLAQQAKAAGFTFSTIGDVPYWDESVRYEFSLSEIEEAFEQPTAELYALCLELVDRVLEREELMDKLGLPPALRDLAAASWRRRDPTLYGRFDFSMVGGKAKLLEFNADTPTSLYESAVFQWTWFEQGVAAGFLSPEADQFNSIHDRLVAHWPAVARGQCVSFASLPNDEDAGTTSYVRETAAAAGVDIGPQLAMRDIGLASGRFVDLDTVPIECLFKLYPWEWLAKDEFGASPAMCKTRFVEPAWKALLSTKAILPLLWDLAPGHPNLLPARFEDDDTGVDVGREYVRKPCLSREGANIAIVRGNHVDEATSGHYSGRCVLQTFAPLPDFDGARPVIGSWIVGDQAAGIGIREASSAITTNTARFVPHVIVGDDA